MKTEKIVLSFIAVVSGLLVAFVAFFIYQSTKAIPPSKVPTLSIAKPTPTTAPTVYLSIDQPVDESVTDSRTITVSGKTTPEATIVLNTATDDTVVTPATNGNYSITTTINTGENQITVTAIEPNGEEVKKIVTVTSSAEQF